ncbi:MAG: hypothetical protein HRT89_01240 [Lentisphaeria bacterium]|nr:hypothetical protein [Lentisphaeria bacterium]NQZ66669.1 hypothetical protein [Lentisphaeria bacterium]
MKRCLLILLTAVAFTGCVKSLNYPIALEDSLTEVERTNLKLPAKRTLTRETKTDKEYAAELSPTMIKAILYYYYNSGTKAVIYAARPVGGYLLLWLEFPYVGEGRIGVIWSVKENKPVGIFEGQ